MRSFVYNYEIVLENETVILQKVYLIENEDFTTVYLCNIIGMTEDNKHIVSLISIKEKDNYIFQACIEDKDNDNKRCDITKMSITADIVDNECNKFIANNKYDLVIKNCKNLLHLEYSNNVFSLLPYNIFIINCKKLNIYSVEKVNALLNTRHPSNAYTDYFNTCLLEIPEIFIDGKTSNVHKRIENLEEKIKLLLNENKEKDVEISELKITLNNIIEQLNKLHNKDDNSNYFFYN